MQNKKDNLLFYTIIIIVIFYHLSFLFLSNIFFPREYHLTLFTDVENDYLFNIKLLFNNYDVRSVYHPGSPVFLIGKLIMNFTTDNINEIQKFFRINYFIIIILTLFSIVYFVTYFKKQGVNPLLVFLAVSLILTYPSFNVYLERLSSDSFMPIISIFLSIFFWKLNFDKIKIQNILIFGFILGFGTSIKLSLIPLGVILIIYFLFFGFNSGKNSRYLDNIKYICIISFASLLSFIIGFLPSLSISNLKNLIVFFLRRFSASSDITNITFVDIQNVFLSSFPLSILIIISLSFLTKNIKIIYKEKKLMFLNLSVLFILFLFLKDINFLRTNYLNQKIYEYQFRQGIIVMPFISVLVFILYRNIKINVSKIPLFIVLSIFIFHNSFNYFKNRNALIEDHQKKRLVLINEIKNLNVNILAMWMEHPETTVKTTYELGKETFLHWGNYKFAKRIFNNELSDAFPELRFLEFKFNKELKKFDDFFIEDFNDVDAILISKKHLGPKFDLDINDFLKILNKKRRNVIDMKEYDFYYVLYLNKY
jgi:hypothetical protein